jgi:RNA polymerase sigma-70 factor (ECF subfamily)
VTLELEVAHEPEPSGDTQLAAAIAQLSDADREILRLVAWEALPLRDAARVLECSPVAARVRYHRAKSRLGALLDTASSFRPEPKEVTR